MAVAAPYIIAAAGTAFTAYSTYQQGQAAKEIGDYNARVAESKAAEARQTAVLEEQAQRDKNRLIAGQQRAAMGASGAAVDSGSFGQVLEQTAELGELDALTARTNALKQAWGYESQAAASRYEGQMAKRSATGKAAGTLLTAGPDVYRAGKEFKWWGQ